MLFWVVCAALAVIVALAILAPFWRGARTAPAPGAAGSAAYDLGVYRDQLREVDRDLARGVIGTEDADRLRTEIGRKVLDADRRLAAETAGPAARRGGPLGAALAVAAVLAVAAGVYWREGTPMADLPLAARIAAAEQTYNTRPSQAEAEAKVQLPAPPAPDPQFAELVQKLRDTVAQRPDDPQGVALLAQNEARLGNIPAAIEAQRRLIALRGADATGQDHAQLAALMVQAAGGLITAEAEAEIARALKTDPAQPQARYMAGLLEAQNGRPDRTFPLWARLLEEGPEDAPWIAPIRATIDDLAWLAGQPDYRQPGSSMPTLPGPDSGAVAAAGDMTPEERQQMIAGMVGRLETRLTSEGGTPEEWARLISSLKVMGDAAKSAAMADKARAAFAGQAEALAVIEAAATGASPADGPMMPGPSADQVQAAGDMTPEDRQQLIVGMVKQLEARLATQGGTPEEWARLISSLVVIGEKDHARAIWGEAQTRFGDRPEALAPIAEAAKASGLAE